MEMSCLRGWDCGHIAFARMAQARILFRYQIEFLSLNWNLNLNLNLNWNLNLNLNLNWNLNLNLNLNWNLNANFLNLGAIMAFLAHFLSLAPIMMVLAPL